MEPSLVPGLALRNIARYVKDVQANTRLYQALGFTLTPATISGKEVPQKQRTRRTGDIRKRNLASAIVVRHPETSEGQRK